MHFDIAIIGSGPAGATLARLLSATFSVVIIDKKDATEQSPFKKCCGGLLNPRSQEAIGKFGLGVPKEVLVNPQLFAVHTIDLHTNLERYYQRHYLNINRHQFDSWLIDLIPNRVTQVHKARCTSIIREDSQYKVHYICDNQKQALTCTYLVGAEGARSLVRDTFSPKPIRQYTCIQETFTIAKQLPYYTVFFDKTITDCYGWINIKDDTVQLGAALPKKHAKEGFATIKQRFIEKGFPFQTPIHTDGCLVNRPSSINQITLGKGNAFLVGEAAGLVSPSSLEGISYAMESAKSLALAFNSGKNPRKEYKKNTRSLRAKLLLKMIKSPFIYYPPFRWLVMKSGITTIKIDNSTLEEPND